MFAILITFFIIYPATHVPAFSCWQYVNFCCLVPERTPTFDLIIPVILILLLFIEKCSSSEDDPLLYSRFEHFSFSLSLSRCINAVYASAFNSDRGTLLHFSRTNGSKGFLYFQQYSFLSRWLKCIHLTLKVAHVN